MDSHAEQVHYGSNNNYYYDICYMYNYRFPVSFINYSDEPWTIYSVHGVQYLW